MIYPNNYEKKIGFNDIRQMLRGNCMCSLGWERVGDMEFMTDARDVNRSLAEIREFRRLKEEEEDLPLEFFFDVRQSVARLKLRGTHMEEQELYELMRCLQTIDGFKKCLKNNNDNEHSEEAGASEASAQEEGTSTSTRPSPPASIAARFLFTTSSPLAK